MNDLISIDDAIYYAGNSERVKSELVSKDGKPYMGRVHARVENNPDAFIIEFADIKGSPSYVMHRSVLSKVRPGKADRDAGPEVRSRRAKKDDDNE